MNKEQVTAALLGLLGVSGPIANLLAHTFGMADATIQPLLLILTVLTPLAVGGIFAYLQRDVAKVQGVAHMSLEDLHVALGKIDAASVAQIAEKTPGVATVVVDDKANGKLAVLAKSDAHPNIVTETQNEADAKKGTKV